MMELPTTQSLEETQNNIFRGARTMHCVYIRYQDKSQDFSERLVEPYELKNGSLFAYCRNKGGIRAFKTSRISAAALSEIPFKPRYPILIDVPNK